jgi:GcrA cell cycle regulator
MRRITRPSTAEDEERLKALVAQGASVVRAAAALRRREVAGRERARKLGREFLPVRAARKKWADKSNDEWRD